MIIKNPRLRRIWNALERVLHRIGRFQSALILTVIFAALWVPFGLASRVLADWLRSRQPRGSNWWPRPARFNEPASLKEPF